MVPQPDVVRAQRWVDARNEQIPEGASDMIRFEIDVTDLAVTILECRPPLSPRFGTEWSRIPVARMRYTKVRDEWSLYWSDRDGKFHKYEQINPSPTVDALLAEVDRDPTFIFWG